MSLNYNIYDILLSIINFLFLYLILKKILFKPVTKLMKDRQDQIRNGFKENEEKAASLEVLKNQYTKQLADQDKKIMDILENTKNKADEDYKKIIEEARLEQNKMYKEQQEKIDQEKEEMIKNSKKEIKALSVDLASKIIQREISEQEVNDLTESFIKEVDSK